MKPEITAIRTCIGALAEAVEGLAKQAFVPASAPPMAPAAQQMPPADTPPMDPSQMPPAAPMPVAAPAPSDLEGMLSQLAEGITQVTTTMEQLKAQQEQLAQRQLALETGMSSFQELLNGPGASQPPAGA